MLNATLLVLLQLSGAVTDIDSALRRTLNGEGPSVAVAQAAWADTLGLRATTTSGLIGSGKGIEVADLDPAALQGEIPEGARIAHYVAIAGQGPDPLHLFVPLPEDGSEVVVYRRVEKGLFVEPAEASQRVGAYLKVSVRSPGRFVVHQPAAPGEGKLFVPQVPDPVDDPALKWHWRVVREAPAEATGPIPLILIHGTGIDRWHEFIHWVRSSPEAAGFRSHYQVWNYIQHTDGIDAPIGFDSTCPSFEESIIAYLYRLLENAAVDGVETEGQRYWFPAAGPIALMSHSHGALKARAFMVNYPEYGDRVLAAILIGGPNMGTPWATPEWMRHTASRIGLVNPGLDDRIVDEIMSTTFFSSGAQCDLDMGWGNYDAGGAGGFPYARFTTWTRDSGRSQRVLSPRDANITGARTLPGIEDTTFEPQQPLGTWCGGLEHITPRERGDRYADKCFLYGSYLDRNRGWFDMLRRADDGVTPAGENRFNNVGLRIANVLMGIVASEGGDWPASPYRAGDGFIPLQSQLMLDGREDRFIYQTREVAGWTVPRLPLQLDQDLINAHTLADPAKIRIFPGWSHFDTVTGRYNQKTGHSELFVSISRDLMGVLPES